MNTTPRAPAQTLPDDDQLDEAINHLRELRGAMAGRVIADGHIRPSYRYRGELPKGLDTLCSLRQWLTWDYVWDEKKAKWQKPPRSSQSGTRASATDPRNWGSYDEALATAKRKSLAGIGISLSADDGLTGIDLDNCRDPETGALSDLAAEIIALAETYAEISPSGRGIRLFALGKVSRAWKDDSQGIEIYGQGRYLTVTGDQVPRTPDRIADAPKTLERLITLVEAAREQAKERQQKATGPARPASTRAARGGTDFFRTVNALALARLDAWVPRLFPKARRQATGGWRVTSAELGRDLEEDLSIHPNGIQDFGLEKTCTAIDLMLEHGGAPDAEDAALLMCEMLDCQPQALGWRSRRSAPRPKEPPEAIEAQPAKEGSRGRRKPPETIEPPEGEDNRPVIRLRPSLLHEAVDHAEKILVEAGPGPIYQRSGQLVHVTQRPALRSDGAKESQEAIAFAQPALFSRVLAERARCERYVVRDKAWTPCDPPDKLAEQYYALGQWNVSILQQLIGGPTLRHDGTLLNRQGYDPSTGLYLTSEVKGLDVPKRPTEADAERANETLTGLLNSFPFFDPPERPGQSLAVAMAGLLTGVARATLPAAPLTAVSAPQQGTGKSLLVDLFATIATGTRAACVATGGDLQEFEKSLAAELLESRPLLSLDNMVQPLQGQLLAMILSQHTVKVRVLGLSKMVSVSTSAAMFATGNNLQVKDDLGRRTLLCKLDAQTETPENRTFDHDLMAEAMRRRTELLSAALTILRWRFCWPHPDAPGSPSSKLASVLPLAGYADWCRRVRDPLVALGHADPVRSIEQVRATDDGLEVLGTLLEQWHAWKTEPATCRHAIDSAIGEFRDAIKAATREKDDPTPKKLGFYLRGVERRTCNGKRFVNAGTSGGNTRWRVEEC